MAEFRDGQWEAIEGLISKEQMLVVQRTGWGKSSVYFISTRILRDRGRGPTLIISPLLALMRNQIDAASRLGIRAESINSTNRSDWPKIIEAVSSDRIDVLLISPERLSDEEFVADVLMPISGSIGMLVVDEAHCISDWGHDFRPDYRRLVNILKRMPENVPILGTTATANNRVVNDVKSQLGNIAIQRGTLMRESLSLQNIRLPSQSARLAWLAEHVKNMPGTGIIYTLTKSDANQVTDWLNQHDVVARAYFSGIHNDEFEDSDSYRQYLESLLLNNKIKVLVATTALGMGYDKPDLGFVIHYQAPSSIVSYYQQVGRAGRGIDHAIGILLSGKEDDEIHEFFRRSAFPRESWVISVLDALRDSDGLTITELEERVNLRRSQIEKVVKFLSVDNPAPVIKNGSKWQRTPVFYKMDHERIQRLMGQRLSEWEEMQSYIDEQGCLMDFLARALDDHKIKQCGRCARCRAQDIVSPKLKHDLILSAGRFLKHSEFPLECKKQAAKGAFRVYDFTGNLPESLRCEVGRVLSKWGDAGWGQIVANDKHNGFFRDELVYAVREMLVERWRPEPSPRWVTCVPSHKRPDLVPNFASRLAKQLGLPFQPIVHKIAENEPQKYQQNRFHQCRNLDGVFSISELPLADPVLLVDDVVDSSWTLTVIAALLRKAGSGPVWPLALTTSNIGA